MVLHIVLFTPPVFSVALAHEFQSNKRTSLEALLFCLISFDIALFRLWFLLHSKIDVPPEKPSAVIIISAFGSDRGHLTNVIY